MKIRRREILAAGNGLTDQFKSKNRIRRETFAAANTEYNGSSIRNDLFPDLKLSKIAIGDIKVSGRKTRKHGPEQLRNIMHSISRLGFCAPIIVGKGNEVIDGEARIEAARQMGLAEIPAINIGHLNEVERRSLRLAINRLGEKAEWDIDALKLEFEELIVLEAPLEIIGFSSDEIDQTLMDDEENGLEAGPLVPATDAKPIAKRGDLFLLGPHRLICGDSTDPATYHALFFGLQKSEVPLVFTDEPYNVPITGHVTSGDHREFAMASGEMSDSEFLNFNKAWIGAVLPHVCDGGLFATFIDWRGLPIVHDAALFHALFQLNLIVWAKTNAGQGGHYRSQHELLPLYKKGKAPHINNIKLGKNGRHRSNLWTYPGASSLGSDARCGLKDHPTVKPTAMLEDALLDITNRGDTVIDPFLGSGSTLIASQKTGRICFGIEIDPLYVDLICRRFEKETGTSAILADTGETFPKIAGRGISAQSDIDR
jgi:DNA modification methylase